MAAIEATGLVKTFKARKNTVKALDGIDLEVPEGTVLGLLGPNGAGKTTGAKKNPGDQFSGPRGAFQEWVRP